MSEESGQTRWSQIGGATGEEYAERLAARAREGGDPHGEATFCASRLSPGARVLDAGCGTGRVAVRLDELGFSVVGVDVDESMLAVARRTAPHLAWHRADLDGLGSGDLDGAAGFDLVVMAGNVVPLLAAGTVGSAVSSLTTLLKPGGLLVAGFGLDPAHLPAGCPVTPLSAYDEACGAAGLSPRERFSTWEGAPFEPSSEYAVSVHALASAP
ncbi:MAG TPA: methyltransferase domain-containing protein [Nocardioidaceae bacterium]|nr:methyltransferase domain-containing protein [Nocardioidaceae bacterium]